MMGLFPCFSPVVREHIESSFSDNKVNLFHYTNLAGLQGIISSETLRATNIRYLNDTTEFIHGIEMAGKVLSTLKYKQLEVYDRRPHYYAIEKVIEEAKGDATFISSLSEDGDVLSQWRGYSGSSGASIGLNVWQLRNATDQKGFRIIKCIYNDQEKECKMSQLIHWALQGVDPSQISYDLNILAASFKNSNFYEEKEWRIVYTIWSSSLDLNLVDFRTTSKMLVPYINLNLRAHTLVYASSMHNMCIDKIFFGPGVDISMARASIGLMLRKSNISIGEENILPSAVPYRTSS